MYVLNWFSFKNYVVIWGLLIFLWFIDYSGWGFVNICYFFYSNIYNLVSECFSSCIGFLDGFFVCVLYWCEGILWVIYVF